MFCECCALFDECCVLGMLGVCLAVVLGVCVYYVVHDGLLCVCCALVCCCVVC